MCRRIALVVMTLWLALQVGIGQASAAPPPLPGMDEMMAQMEQDIMELQGLTGKDFEIAFLEKMIPHHQSAVMMAQMAQMKATHPEVRKLAGDIIASQQAEVTQMRGWLASWYGITNPQLKPMAGMDKMMAAMDQLTGADFEQAFLMMMPQHHQGAVDMAAQVPGRATHPELIKLARDITASQQAEIAQMRQWAMDWYGFDPAPMSHGGRPMPGLPNTGGGAAVNRAVPVPQVALTLLLAALVVLPAGACLRRLACDGR